jgi:hypothetical protein
LEAIEADASLVSRVRSIDFYFLNLNQLRQELWEAFRHEPEQTATTTVIA